MTRTMLRISFVLAIASAALLWPRPSASQAPTVQNFYQDALAKEQAVRAALAGPLDAAPALKAVRTVVLDYEAIVRRFPSSGYSDDALWNAGRLSLDAFQKYGDQQDRAAGERLLRMLSAEYPTSKFAGPAGSAAAAVPPAADPPRLATITDIQRSVLSDAIRITIHLDGETTYRDDRLANPARVFVDLPSTRLSPALVDRTLRFDGDTHPVRQIRTGRHPQHTSRVVLEAAGIASYRVYTLTDPFRLVVDCVPTVPGRSVETRPAKLAPPPPTLTARRLPAESMRPLPDLSPVAATALAEARPPEPLPLPAAVIASPVAAPPPARNLAGGLSLARQLGLGVSRIVIDPGHGGHDPGARGRSVTEADVVLDVALRLEKLLLRLDGIEVVLTRRSDEFVSLEERTAIANREAADLFLSIHANASNNAQTNGVETYFLNFANNMSAASVAARENAASGQTMGALPDVVKTIALNNKLDESRDFATYVQRALIETLRPANRAIRDLGVKQAPFVVLIGAAMPSVLAEVSFITNTQDARLLRNSTYRQRIAEALLAGIQKYQGSLKGGTKVAQGQP